MSSRWEKFGSSMLLFVCGLGFYTDKEWGSQETPEIACTSARGTVPVSVLEHVGEGSQIAARHIYVYISTHIIADIKNIDSFLQCFTSIVHSFEHILCFIFKLSEQYHILCKYDLHSYLLASDTVICTTPPSPMHKDTSLPTFINSEGYA